MTDQTLTAAVRYKILGTGTIPTSTLAVASHAGDTTVTLADAHHFVRGGLVSFEDGTAERQIPILSKSGNTLTLNTAGFSSGLQFDHAQNVTVSTNLLSFIPNDISDMLVLGDAVVFVLALTEDGWQHENNRLRPVVTMHIEYRRSLVSPASGPNSGMDRNLWAQLQQDAARTEIAAIKTALLADQTLTTSTPAQSDAFGMDGGGRPLYQIAWNKTVVDLATQQFMAAINVTVRAKRLPTR